MESKKLTPGNSSILNQTFTVNVDRPETPGISDTTLISLFLKDSSLNSSDPATPKELNWSTMTEPGIMDVTEPTLWESTINSSRDPERDATFEQNQSKRKSIKEINNDILLLVEAKAKNPVPESVPVLLQGREVPGKYTTNDKKSK